jgi:hypothetical protein
VKVPGDATLDFGKGRGPDDVPVEMVTIKTGDMTVSIDEATESNPKRTVLADRLERVKVKDAALIHKVEPSGGFAIAYAQDKSVVVWASFAAIDCGVTFEAKDATPAKTEAAFNICASYVPSANS